MANFSLSDLRLVRPRDGWPQARAWASASGAHGPLEGARVFDRLEDAIADLRLVLATTARPREAMLPVLTPGEGAARLAVAIAAGLPAGLVFGGERAGLSSDDIALCHAIVTAPIDPAFRSLNLAQAVAINAYEWRLTRNRSAPEAFTGAPAPAEQAEIMGLFSQLETELDEAGFFHPPEKRPSMVRTLRIALGRAQLSSQEVRTLRGVVTALSKGRGRVLAKLAGRRTPSP
jgi:tRNA/rRNA methyltransferase